MEKRQVIVYFIASSILCSVYAVVMEVTIQPESIPVWFVEGKSLELTCVVHTDEDVDIVWRKNEQPVDEREYKIDYWVSADQKSRNKHARLRKVGAGSSDVAIFRCSVKGVDLISQTSMIQIVTAGANMTEGANSTLRCQAALEYELKRVTWYKGSTPLSGIPSLRERIVLGPDNSTVTVLNTKLSDQGEYTCRVELDPDTPIKQEFLEKVPLQGKPYITQNATQEMHKDTIHYSIVLRCQGSGHPRPDLFWKKGKSFRESSEKIQISTAEDGTSQLKINNPSDSDFDVYTCVAQNNQGIASFVFDLSNSGATSLAFNGCTFFKVNLYAAIVVLVMKLTK